MDVVMHIRTLFFTIFISITCTIHAHTLPPFLQNHNQWAEETVKTLSLQEKIGQLFIIAAATDFDQPTELLASAMQQSPYNLNPDYIERMISDYHVGGVIFLFKSDPRTQMMFTQRLQQKAKIPLLIAQDGEWGLSMRLDKHPNDVVRYPRNMTLGAIQNKQLLYQLGYEIGMQCKAIGVHINMAPVVDVNNNAHNMVIHDRSFGDNPQLVSECAYEYMRGLQDAGIIACAKHFPGHGDTHIDSHIDLPIIFHNLDRLHNVELVPFRFLIDAGVSAIMSAHIAFPACDATNIPASLSQNIITELLQHKLSFCGLSITDGLGMQALIKYYKPGEIECNALCAGNDLLLCPVDVPRAIACIENAIIQGRISEETINHHVLKILKAKAWACAQQKQFQLQYNSLEKMCAFLIRPEAYQLQQQLYREAITHAKIDDVTQFGLEFFARSCVIHIGQLPETIFAHECARYTNSVYSCSASMTDEELQHCLQRAQHSEHIIIALAQLHKHADKSYGISENTQQLFAPLKNMNKKIHVIIFGTPYAISYCKNADSIIVAYEDISVCQLAAIDVLKGTLHPQGKLPIL